MKSKTYSITKTALYIRNSLALLFRYLPGFRGKSHIGTLLGKLLNFYIDGEDCIVTVKLKDASLMQLDIRSRTEQWAYWTGYYDYPIISKLCRSLQSEWVVFDVGANVGFYTIPFGKRLSSLNGKVYAIEPVPSNSERLSNAVKLNHLESTVLVQSIALGDEEGIMSMWVEATNNASTGNAGLIRGNVDANPETDRKIKVQIKTLDNFAQEQQIISCNLIKIDIEGAEVMFLKGGINFITKHRPIIYGEFNTYFMHKFGYSFLDVINILKPLGYEYFKEIKDGNFVKISQPHAEVENVLLVPNDLPESIASCLEIKI
jgi:FkbM family methyltransferase